MIYVLDACAIIAVMVTVAPFNSLSEKEYLITEAITEKGNRGPLPEYP